MYTKALRADITSVYTFIKGTASKYCRWEFPHDRTKPVLSVKFPGPNHIKLA